MSGSRIALCLPPMLEARLARELERNGYEVVDRCPSAERLEERLALDRAQLALVAASVEHLTGSLLARADAAGVRTVALADTDSDRRHAASLGLLEVIDADAGWEELEAVLLGADPVAATRTLSNPERASLLQSNGRSNRPSDSRPSDSRFSGQLQTSIPEVADSASPPSDGNEFFSHAERTSGTAERTSGTAERTSRTVERGSGTVVAVWGPAGAPGRSTIATAIAAEIAAAGFSVALADVDTYSASIAPALGLLDETPGFAAACRLAGTDDLDDRELERIAERYRSAHGGFWVLTGLGRPSRWPELSAQRVTAAIGACRDWVDYTVVDVGASLERDDEISSDAFAPRRNAATLAALAAADRIIAVGAADPVGLARFLRAYSDLSEIELSNDTDPSRRASPDIIAERPITVVMNRVRASAIGLTPDAQVRETLHRFGGIGSPVLIPDDGRAVDAAVLSGKTLRDAAAKSPARLAIARLVTDRLLPPPIPLRPRHGWLRRFGTMRTRAERPVDRA